MDADNFLNPTDPIGPVARERGGTNVVETRHEPMLSKENKAKSLEDIFRSSSDNVSELEKTVNFGPKEDSLGRHGTKEKLELESKKVSPIVMRKAMELPRSRHHRGTLFGDDDASPVLRHKHNVVSGTAAAAAAAAASKSEVCVYTSCV